MYPLYRVSSEVFVVISLNLLGRTTVSSIDTRADKSTRISTDTTFLQRGHKTFIEQNKQFDPGRSREKAPLWKMAVTLPFFLGRSWEASCLFSTCALSMPCVCLFSEIVFSTGDHFSAKLKETRVLNADQVADVRNRRASIFSPMTLLKMARTSNTRFDRSANPLG